MPIQNFIPDEYAKNMAQEAMQVVPLDLSQSQGEYIINKVYQFAALAGDALNQDTTLSLNLEQAQVISQFIGEWTFHKAIDMIRANVKEDHWDNILQQVAFAIFQRAKESMIANVSKDDLVKVIEQEVKNSYEYAMRELANSGVIEEKALPEILERSNLDEMAQIVYDSDSSISDEQRVKNQKYASIALLLKTVDSDRRQKILKNIEQKEPIQSYLEDEHLVEKVDPKQLNDCVKKLNEAAETKKYEPPPVNYLALIKELGEDTSEKEIYDLVKYERKKINNFVALALEDEPTKDMVVKFSPHLSKVIYRYLKTKVNIEN